MFTLQSLHLNLPMDLFHIWKPILSNQLMMMKWTNSWNSSNKSMMLIFWILTSIWFRNSGLTSGFYFIKTSIVSTVLFHKYGGENVGVKICMSHFYMLVPTKVNGKWDNGNMVHAQGIGIILCNFPNCPITYTVGPVYYCPYQHSKNISLGDLKYYVYFEKFTYEPL